MLREAERESGLPPPCVSNSYRKAEIFTQRHERAESERPRALPVGFSTIGVPLECTSLLNTPSITNAANLQERIEAAKKEIGQLLREITAPI